MECDVESFFWSRLRHIVSTVVAIALLIYLIAALLNPEDFS